MEICKLNFIFVIENNKLVGYLTLFFEDLDEIEKTSLLT